MGGRNTEIGRSEIVVVEEEVRGCAFVDAAAGSEDWDCVAVVEFCAVTAVVADGTSCICSSSSHSGLTGSFGGSTGAEDDEAGSGVGGGSASSK